jgi:hypothetical protein
MEVGLGMTIRMADRGEIIEGHGKRMCREAEAERDGGSPEAQRLPLVRR